MKTYTILFLVPMVSLMLLLPNTAAAGLPNVLPQTGETRPAVQTATVTGTITSIKIAQRVVSVNTGIIEPDPWNKIIIREQNGSIWEFGVPQQIDVSRFRVGNLVTATGTNIRLNGHKTLDMLEIKMIKELANH